MDQTWIWVVLAVVVVAVLAMTLTRGRQRSSDAPPVRDDAPGPVSALAAEPDVAPSETEPIESEADAAEARSVAAGFAGAGPSAAETADDEPPGTRPADAADPALAGLDTNGARNTGPSFGAAAAAVSAVTTKPGPHPGSALPAPDGSSPSPEYLIKANSGARRYYPPDSPYYTRTRGDLWFRAAADAEAAGFTAAR